MKRLKLNFPLLLSSIIIVLAYFLYLRYGYLIKSVKNLPSPTEIQDTEPKELLQPSNPKLSFINLPEGFAIDYFSDDIPGARSLAVDTDGTVYVGTRSEGVVYALVDIDNDMKADTRFIVASGLNSPNGVALLDGDLYVAEISKIIKFTDISSNYMNKPSYEVIYNDLPSESHHGWRFLSVGSDNRLYVAIGAPCNICDEGDPFASIASLNSDGSDFKIIARGIRNSVGFDWNPVTGNLWFTDNGRDWFGDDIPPDELNVLTQNGQHFGYPYCHGTNLLDTDFGENNNCDEYKSPIEELGPHIAALGIEFYEGEMFPSEYKAKLFIAEHGSWNRTIPIGYRISMVEVNGDDASDYKTFADGWLDEKGNAIGRPVDVLEIDDGSLLISDDKAGVIYRIYYSKN